MADDRKEPRIAKEYSFARGTRGKYAARYAAGTNVVVLDPDVAAVFTNSRLVNETLRAIAKLAPARRRAASR